jgi:predicted secreted protein
MTTHTLTALCAALLLAACASSGEKTFKSIAAPTKPGVETRITSSDAGNVINVRVGTKIAVELVGVPTAGYMWSAVKTPPFLKADGDMSGPTSEAQLQPGFAGGNHWEVFFFDVESAGDGELKLEQRRVWDEEGPAEAEFFVTVKAR